jgi:ferredoxin
MQIIVDRESCCSSSLCVYTVPEVFDQDDEGIVVVQDQHPPSRLHDIVRQAARACPTGTIRVVDDQAHEQAQDSRASRE